MTENRGRHSADSWELGSKYTRNVSNASDAEPRWNARQLKSLTEAARAEGRGSLQQRDRDCYGHWGTTDKINTTLRSAAQIQKHYSFYKQVYIL